MLVHVLNSAAAPLIPCSWGKARRLLNEGQAKVIGRSPFVIKLLCGSSGFKQPVTLSIDSGSQVIGLAATGNGNVLYASEVKTRSDIHEKMSQRTSYHRTRRGRNLGYRKARFANRKRPAGWITPTMRSKVRSHLREIEFIKRILPVTHTIIEIASFAIDKIVNPDVSGEGYQQGRQKEFYNLKQLVLARDGYCCQKCLGKKKDEKLHVHHIIFRSNGGTNSPDNLITLCKTCHDNLHLHQNAETESLKIQKNRKGNTTDAVQVSTIGCYLKKSLPFEATFGYETKCKREALRLPKEHYIDVICIGLSDGEIPRLPDVLYKKVCISLGDYKQTAGGRSEKSIPTEKLMGIRKFDKVGHLGHELFVKGRMSTGYAVLMDIDGKTVHLKPMAKLKTITRISARRSCLTSVIPLENSRFNTMVFSSANTESTYFSRRELISL